MEKERMEEGGNRGRVDGERENGVGEDGVGEDEVGE